MEMQYSKLDEVLEGNKHPTNNFIFYKPQKVLTFFYRMVLLLHSI